MHLYHTTKADSEQSGFCLRNGAPEHLTFGGTVVQTISNA